MAKPSKRSKHEAKPEQDDGFKGSYESSTRAHPKWRVGDAERTPLELVDMSPSPDLTGRWLDEQFGFYLYVNHVGRHIELLIACIENGASGKESDVPRDKLRCETRLIRMGGDLDENDKVSLYLRLGGKPLDDKSFICGHLQGDDRFIQLDLMNETLYGVDERLRERIVRYAKRRAKRMDREPNLFPHHLVTPGVPAEFRSAYWFPPTARQLERARGYILGARVRVADNYIINKSGSEQGFIDLVRDYFRLRVGTIGEDLSDMQVRQRQANIAESLDRLVWQAYQDALLTLAEDGGIDEFLHEYWSYESLETLLETDLHIPGLEGDRPLIELTQIILDCEPGLSHKSFAKYLYMSPTGGGHYYGGHIALGGGGGNSAELKKELGKLKKGSKKIARRIFKSLPAGALIGLVEVRKEEDPDLVPEQERKPPEWTGYYAIALFGYSDDRSAGQSEGSGSESDGHARNVYGQAWTPEQLAGKIALRELGISAHAGPKGKGESLTILSFYGRGEARPRTPLHVDFSGLADVFGHGAAISIGAKMLGGFATYIQATAPIYEHDFERPAYEFEYSGNTATAPIHFPINGAAPEAAACALLEILAANELDALSRKECEIEVHGYADQPDSDIKNLILSRSRAISVYNYIKGIAHSHMAHGQLSAVKSEEEELEAYRKQKPDERKLEIEDPSTSKVTVTAHGEPPRANGQKKESYDSTYRRVDIAINGKARLFLRRKDDETGA